VQRPIIKTLGIPFVAAKPLNVDARGLVLSVDIIMVVFHSKDIKKSAAAERTKSGSTKMRSSVGSGVARVPDKSTNGN
jgi:hypothetical protein